MAETLRGRASDPQMAQAAPGKAQVLQEELSGASPGRAGSAQGGLPWTEALWALGPQPMWPLGGCQINRNSWSCCSNLAEMCPEAPEAINKRDHWTIVSSLKFNVFNLKSVS